MESKNNIQFICSDCTNTKRQQWQLKNINTVLKIGDFVKIAFSKNKIIEHMWVRLCFIGEGILIGKLDNEPHMIDNICFGDYVAFFRSEIEEYASGE